MRPFAYHGRRGDEANLLAVLPPLAFFLIFQRKIVEGIAMSGPRMSSPLLDIGIDIGAPRRISGP